MVGVQNVVICRLLGPQPRRLRRPSRGGFCGDMSLSSTNRMRGVCVNWALILHIILGFALPCVSCSTYDSSSTRNEKDVNVSYIEIGKVNRTEVLQSAEYLITPTFRKPASGILIQPKKGGCEKDDYLKNDKLKFPLKHERWIALVTLEKCSNSNQGGLKSSSELKIKVAKELNASAVLFYGSKLDYFQSRQSDNSQIPVIQLSQQDGDKVSKIVAKDNAKVWIDLQPSINPQGPAPIKKSSVLFVSISFIVLMVISLAWLIFYYVQRFRYAQARDRTQKRLGRAARKAIAKLPSKSVKECDLDFDYENCPVCLESYRMSDNLRILPCKHYFHKHCVDQWLIEHRTCPMCKLNILKALGYQPASRPSEDTFAIEIAEQAMMPMSDSSGILVVHLESIQFNPRRHSSSSCSHLMGQGSTNSSSQDRSQDEEGFQEVMAVAELHHDIDAEGSVMLPPGSSLV